MPAYSGSISREEDFLREIPARVQGLLSQESETVVLVAFQKNPTGIYHYRIYKSKNKEDFFSGYLLQIGHDLMTKGYTVYVYVEHLSEIKKHTYEEFLKTR